MKTSSIQLIFTALLALTISPLPAQAETLSQWRTTLYGRSADDTLSTSRVVGITGMVNIERDLGDSLHARFLGDALLEVGSSSALFTDEFQPASRLHLTEASLRWKVFSLLSVTAGALDQSFLKSPLLIARGTFPAALANLRLGKYTWVMDLQAQAAIPTSQRLSTKSAGKEPTPTFYTQTLSTGWQDSKEEYALVRATHFDFRNLTHGMAQDSRFYGNSVGGIAAASSYLYPYEGTEFGADAAVGLGSGFQGVLGASLVQNRASPATKDNGCYAYAGFRWVSSSLVVQPIAEWYENESDAVPAFYSSGEFGHNNRRGGGGMLHLELKNPGIELELRARNTKLIQAQPFQKNNFQFYQLTVGIPYANF